MVIGSAAIGMSGGATGWRTYPSVRHKLTPRGRLSASARAWLLACLAMPYTTMPTAAEETTTSPLGQFQAEIIETTLPEQLQRLGDTAPDQETAETAEQPDPPAQQSPQQTYQSAPYARRIDPEQSASNRQPGHFERTPSNSDPQVRAQILAEQAETHAQAGDNLSAAHAYRRALELQPGLSRARQGYARILVMTHRTKRARQILREGLQRGDNSELSARFYAHLAEQAGYQQRAITVLEKVNAPNDDTAGAIEAHLAALHRQLSNHDQALMYYTRLARSQPNNGLRPAGQALAAEALGDRQSALKAWQRALELGLSAEIASYAQSRVADLRE